MKLEQGVMQQKNRGIGSMVYNVILACALSVGCWYSFFSMFGNFNFPVLTLVCVLILPIVFLLLCNNKKIGKYLTVYVLMGVALYFLLTYKTTWDGFLTIGNIVIDSLNQKLGTGYLDFKVSGNSYRNVIMAIVPLFVLTSIAIGYSISRKEPLVAFIFTSVPILVGLFLKGVPGSLMFLLLILAWVGLFLLSAGAGKLLFIGLALILMCGWVVLFTDADYQPAKTIDQAKNNIVQATENFRYGGNDIEGLSKGDLTKVHGIVYSDVPVFKVTMEKTESMYLRGYVGAKYNNDKWEQTVATDYAGDYKGINQWLANNGFYSWCQMNNIYRMDNDYKYQTITIENLTAASNYTYIPYEAAVVGELLPDKVDYDQDRALLSKGIKGDREYEIKVFRPSLGSFTQAKADKWLKEVKGSSDFDNYLKNEKVYRKFVYDNYLDVSNEGKSAIKNTGIEKCHGKTIDYTLYYIRNLFSKNYRYDLETEAAPKGTNELMYFMNKSKVGNDMHFATAATLMMREAGIPARYVEGYYLSDSFMSSYKGSKNAKLDIPDSLNHAWVEIYVDEVGWVPVEVVPGFFKTAKQKTQQEEDTQTLQETDQQIYPDKVEIDSEPETNSERKNEQSWLWLWILIGIVGSITIYEIIGRLWLIGEKDLPKSYKYMSRLTAYDKIKIKKDPYYNFDKISKRYDMATTLTYGQVMRLIYRDRFSDLSITKDEEKDIAQYTKELSKTIYELQNWYKKFIMRFIKFLY